MANELCTICAPSFHASDGEDSSIRLPLHPIHDFCGAGEERGQAMQAFKNTLFASVGALLISAAPVAPEVVTANSNSVFNARRSERSLARVDWASGDPYPSAGYSPLGIAKINGRRFAVNSFQNGAKRDDAAGQGQGFADIYDNDGHLIRRFAFRESLNSPPQITEYVSMPPR
ncbi:MAG TPA: hypothetical protein VGA33_07075 [Thermoanaerobaculia bacterium]